MRVHVDLYELQDLTATRKSIIELSRIKFNGKATQVT